MVVTEGTEVKVTLVASTVLLCKSLLSKVPNIERSKIMLNMVVGVISHDRMGVEVEILETLETEFECP